MRKLTTTFYYLLISLRPRQWLKNLSVFAALFFGGRFFNLADFQTISFVFIIFCLQSSAVYLLNDVIDIKADQAHFSKKDRPIAKGLFSPVSAIVTSVFLSGLSLFFSHQVSDLVLLTN